MSKLPESPVMRPLGIFRLFLAFLVVLQHVGVNLLPPDLAYYCAVWQPGTVGIVTFLFLSAFIILDVATSNYFDHPFRFIANRALRILPEFFVALIVAIAVQYFLFQYGDRSNAYFYPMTADAFSLKNILLNAVALVPTPSSPMTWDFVYTIWTVRYEIVFYVLVFGVLCTVNIAPASSRAGLFERVVLSGAISVIAFALLAPLEGTHKFMATLYSFIAVGALYYTQCEARTLGKAPEILVQSGVLVVLTLLLLDYTKSPLATALTLGMVIVAMGLLNLRITDRALARLDHVCGDLSYTLFLLHLQVATLIKNFMGASIAAFMAATVLSFALAYVVSNRMRKITGPLRNRIRGRALSGQSEASTSP